MSGTLSIKQDGVLRCLSQDGVPDSDRVAEQIQNSWPGPAPIGDAHNLRTIQPVLALLMRRPAIPAAGWGGRR